MGLAGTNGAKVIEVASGTGKFTELLAERPEEFEITAIEPHDGMRHHLESKKLKRVNVLDGHASAMPIREGLGEGCIAAQVQ